MTRPATIADVLGLAAGKLHQGRITHVDCGGYQVVWSLYLNRAQCVGCCQAWQRTFLEDMKKNEGKPASGYLRWRPPMEISDVEA